MKIIVEKGGWDEGANFWRHRLIDPDEFRKDTFRTKKIADGVEIVIGKRDKNGVMEVQTILFDKSKFGKKEAMKWFEEHWEKAKKDMDV